MISRLLLVLLLVVLSGSALAVDGIECALSVFQRDTRANKDVLLFADTSRFIVGMPTIGFPLAFSVDIEFTESDTSGCTFMVHAVTLGQPVNNYSRQFRAEYGVPARLDGIVGKPGTNYSLVMSPLARIDIDTSGCGYTHRRPGDFGVDPTGYLDIHYVQGSFGDYYWNTVKGIMEERYRLFKSINNFSLPGKYELFLCPCPIYSVIWDKRFGMVVDPTRSLMFALYNKEHNSADPFIVMHASIFRNYGYAPPFLSEGYAGYLSLAAEEMKRIVAEGRNLPLVELLDTYAYLTADPVIADRTVATFVKYLVNEYGIDKFLTTYRQAHDLNLKPTIEEVYGKDVASLETEWLHYVDTVTITTKQLQAYADLAEAMFDHRLVMRYGEQLLDLSRDGRDSLEALKYLVRGAFSLGDYYRATELQQAVLNYEDSVARNWAGLAGYRMMNGYYDEAVADLQRAKTLDSADQMIDFNRALNALSQGDTLTARQLLGGIILNPNAGGPQVQARIMLGYILLHSGDADDRVKADQYFREAISNLGQALRSGSATPEAHMWTGMAYLGIGDTGNAWDLLLSNIALDDRPFYQGMSQLYLGMVADVRGEHDVAAEHYGAVLSGASADYHQKQARAYLDKPYQQ